MRKWLKTKGVLLSSILSLGLSVLLLATASFAWLSMNLETQSNGMQLKVEVSPNLIINQSSSALQAVTGATAADFTTTFSTAAVATKPATHKTASATGLEYVTNPGNVSPTTGLAKTGSLTFADVSTTEYYIDFTVYIASTGAAMTGMDLTVSLAPAASIAGSGTYKADTLAATSVDFYVGSVTSGNYKGTLNVAGLSASANDYTTALTTVTLLSNGDIPLNSSSYITVIMRCYIDGALLKSSGQAYINTEKVDTSDITLNATFVAAEHS